MHTTDPAGALDLETRVEAKRKALVDELAQLDVATQAVARDRIKARLAELAHIVKQGVVDGWANLGPVATSKLNAWIAK